MYPGKHAQTTPDKTAYLMAGSGEAVTYRQLDDDSNQVAQLLRARRIRPGDGIAIFMENNAAYFKATWAAQRSGLYYTCVSSRLTAGEVAYIVNDCGAKALITSHALRDVAAEVLDQIPNVHSRLMVGGTIEGYESYEDAVSAMPVEAVPDELEGTAMLYSSGTTGRPKGVRHPQSGRKAGDLPELPNPYSFASDSVYLSPAPLYHAAPLAFTMGVLRRGATVVVMEHFDPVEFLANTERHRVTHTQVVPTMFVRLLKLPEAQRTAYDLSSLQVCIHAAAPCPVPVKEQMIEWWGPIIYEYYAGTEGIGSTQITSEDWLEHRGSVGKPAATAIHILDDDFNELPAGGPGGIYFESRAQFEYHNDPDKTAGARSPQGWMTLGDIGYLDADGYLFLTDRKANMIISGGVNVYPQEAENLLTMHPKVLDVAVFGVPNEEMGEEVKAVVQPVSWEDAGPELERELIAYCKEQLAGFKCPRSVDFDRELPRAPTGKLYKRLLRDRYWEGRQTRI